MLGAEIDQFVTADDFGEDVELRLKLTQNDGQAPSAPARVHPLLPQTHARENDG